uniref:Mating factor receptor STE3-2 n=1 Tax=Limonomyces culmigenus TaxID=228944 RepID=A0A0P0KVG2_9AGAM|nr:mating factor receptor STE3-2 [Limonomyces culmigenus]
MTDFAWPFFPIVALLGAVLPLIPLSWHLQAWNSGTCYYMIWASILCLNQFVNAIVWHGTAIDFAPVWCDISTRIIVAGNVAIPLTSLCINRRLYNIARIHGVSLTKDDKRRAVIVDSLICVGGPLLQVALYTIVQGHRYNILEDVGCWPALVWTLPTLFLFQLWPILIGAISGIYCVLSLRALFQRQAQFSQFLASNKAVSASRYMRLMALAGTDVLSTVPVALLMLVVNCQQAFSPYAWADVHYNFGQVNQLPTFEWAADTWTLVGVQLTRYAAPLCALVFFAFFGFAEEARRNYAAAFRAAFGPLAWLSGWRISIHHASASAASSQATLTSTCKFDVEKGWPQKSLDGSDDVPFTPVSFTTPSYDARF